ncbi:MAG: hypothetical protein U0441_30510 [Polyangiaceae bacterium]
MRSLSAVAVLTLAFGVSACSSRHHDSGDAATAPTSTSAASASTTSAAADSAVDERILAELRRFEADRRTRADFGALPASDHRLGADPYAIAIAGPDRYVGLLRGADAVVLLDKELHEIARAPAPGSPTGLAVRGDTAFVVGELASEIRPFRSGTSKLEPQPPIALPDARALRDVAVSADGTLHAVEMERGRLFTVFSDPKAKGGHTITATPACDGAFRVARMKGAVVVDCLFDHRVVAWRTDEHGLPTGAPGTIQNDGPLWSFSALEDDGGLTVASGGVENRALDRTHGSFENIDSFVFIDRIAWADAPKVTRIAAVNVSEHGVILPKAIDLRRDADGIAITALGFGGEAFASIHLDSAPPAVPETRAFPLPPGANAFVENAAGEMVIANPLLDRWILYRTEHLPGLGVAVPDPPGSSRSAASRLGEVLVFTSLMAPWNSSAGPLSRFTCETCHFEGTVDGRTHATGRGDIRATTKPLLGLFNNRPHFSRALDPDLSSVAHNEFRVAGARSDHETIFDLHVTERPWLADLGVTDADLDAVSLRRAFMAFLMDFTPRASAITAGRAAFTDEERRGAELFSERCERCHEARLASDVAASRRPFAEWERAIFSEAAPIVWAHDAYEKTGVVPYVHDSGARVPSLRRLYRKHPYFTNGDAKTLGDVLARARWSDKDFLHEGGPDSAPFASFSSEDRAALEAFLRLL